MTCFESKLINDFGYHEMERRMKFHDKLIKASEICQAERTEFYAPSKSIVDELEEELPPYILPTVHYEKLLMNDPKRIIYVMERMHMMTTTEMKQELKNLHIDFRGKRSQVYERLKNYCLKEYGAIKNAEASHGKLFYNYFVIIDFKCTCGWEKIGNTDHRIFGVTGECKEKNDCDFFIDTFHSYVRPTINPVLTEICIKVTGVTQQIVDNASPFIDVLDEFRTWMRSYKLGRRRTKYAFVTDG
ncbi:unnamed protein product [Dracunculus medinensis]|uniref:Exonuclease domain-containing protein n=1 Tax=Dracunculus medinensis TaxID=318479 RepID=A0A0N4U2P0_DRAME|nr:unnamed protein product [Dracunculus medinensis]